MACGASTAPRAAFFSAALMCFAARSLWTARGTVRPSSWIAASAGVLAAIAIFLAEIHFRLGEFWQTFHFHSSHRISSHRLALLISFFIENPFFSNAQIPLVFILLGLIVFAWPWQPCDLTRATLFILAGFGIEAALGGVGAGAGWYLTLALMLLAAAVLKGPAVPACRLKAVLALGLCLANADTAFPVLGRLSGRIMCERGDLASAALAMRSTPQRTVLVDDSVARYIFDYNIPPGFLDFNFAAPLPKDRAVWDMRPGDTYLVGPESVETLKYCTLLDKAEEAWIPFGRWNRHFYCHPCRVSVINQEDCHGLRAGFRGE
jgi:hypothetical protein